MPLIINDKVIDKLSGPIAFSLIKPKKKAFDTLKKEGTRLPIMMLFGDMHFSAEHQCESCTCSLKNRGCCMPVYSDEFLKIIDSLATKENPVDFSIEDFVTGEKRESLKKELKSNNYNSKKHNDLIPMNMLIQRILGCYVKELRGTKTYTKYCPTKNIRWQFADARQAKGTKYSLEINLNKMFLKLGDLYKKENIPLNTVKDIITRYKKSVGGMYKKLINFNILKTKDTDKAIDYFFEIATPENSLIMKQINKLSPSLKNMELWKDAMKAHLKDENEKFNDRFGFKKSTNITERLEFFMLLLKDDYDTIHSKLKDKKYRDFLTDEIDVSISENSMLLDFYYVTRAFKIPKGDINPFLSISYLGDYHRENIVNLLVNILGYYDLVDTVENQNENNVRCTVLPNINLNKIALEYGVDIKDNLKISPTPKRSPTPRKKSPRNKSPRKKTPRKKTPRKKTPRKKSPRKKTPKRSPRKRSPRKRSPRKRSPRKKSSKKSQKRR